MELNHKVTCLVCDKEFKSISTTHLKSHGLTFETYKQRFPNAVLKSEFTKSRSCITLDNMIRVHGIEQGTIAFENYKNRQAFSNSFEYKQQRYGWDAEQYKEYNKKRAQTLENCIARYGKETGYQKWKDYCEKQKYVGVSLEYFKEKYGDVEGVERYNRMLDKKLASFCGNSKVSGDFFALVDKDGQGIYKPKTDEYSFKTTNIRTRAYFIDFYHPTKKRGIEFYGDYWHCNPAIYASEFITRAGINAKEQWEKDSHRIQTIVEEFKVNILVVWENEYRTDPEQTIKKAQQFIYGS